MPPCNCHHPFPRPEPFSPLPRPGKVPDWGKWIRDRLAEKGALLVFPGTGAFPDPGAGPNLYLAEDTDIVYRWDGAHYQVVFDPELANDVLEYEDRGHFPVTGHHGKLYIAADTGSLYRWSDTDYAELLPGKADKAVPAAEGNLAALTQDGNLEDSGKKPADFATAEQGEKADTAVQHWESLPNPHPLKILDREIGVYKLYSGTTEETIGAAKDGVFGLARLSDRLDWARTAAQGGFAATPAAVKTVNDKVTTIEGKIPSQASSSNQLADKAFVNSSIATETATFRGTFNLVTDLQLPLDATHEQVAAAVKTELGQADYDGNDYVFVQIPQDLEHTDAMKQVDRYKCVETGTDPVVKNWAYEWTLNNSSFTAAQWAAINSGITAGKVAEIDGKKNNFDVGTGLVETSNTLYAYKGVAGTTTEGETRYTIGPADVGSAVYSWDGSAAIPTGKTVRMVNTTIGRIYTEPFPSTVYYDRSAADDIVRPNVIAIDQTVVAKKTDIPAPSTANPAMDGTAAPGTSASYARGDHVHPTDTSRASTADATLSPYWTIDGGSPIYADLTIKWSDEAGHVGWEPFSESYGGICGDAKGDAASTELSWTSGVDISEEIGSITATRSAAYQLGSQTDKPVASEAEAEALRTEVAGKASKSELQDGIANDVTRVWDTDDRTQVRQFISGDRKVYMDRSDISQSKWYRRGSAASGGNATYSYQGMSGGRYVWYAASRDWTLYYDPGTGAITNGRGDTMATVERGLDPTSDDLGSFVYNSATFTYERPGLLEVGTLAFADSNPTAGNLAALDANGNPTDSGVAKSDVESLFFAQYYPDGNVKSAAEFTAGIKYDAPNTTNRTITVLPFCNTGDSDNDNSSLSGRVVIPPFVDASGNPYITDDGTRFKVVGVFGGGLGDPNTNLTAIVAPTTVVRIWYNAFFRCTALTVVSLPSVTDIGDAAFFGCTALTVVSIPSVTDIRSSAFSECTALTSVDFGDTPRLSVPSLGTDAFDGVPPACKIIVPDAQYDAWTAPTIPDTEHEGETIPNPWYALVTAGYKFLRHSEWEYARRYEIGPLLLFAQYYPEGNVKSAAEFTPGVKYVAPDTTNRTIMVGPFCVTPWTGQDNSSLVGRVVIPPFVDAQFNPYISDDGTRYRVVGVAGLEYSYDSQDALTAVVAPNTVTSIGVCSFAYCTSLTSASFTAVTSIGENAFYGCYSLASVSLPAATSIEDYAFAGCTSLESIDFGATLSSVPTLGSNVFNNVPTTCKIIVPDAQYDDWIAATDGWETIKLGATPSALSTRGSLAYAYANGNYTVNGIEFSVAGGSSGIDNENCSVNIANRAGNVPPSDVETGGYKNLLSHGWWANEGSRTVTLRNLTAGHSYLVQIVLSRSDYQTQTATSPDGTAVAKFGGEGWEYGSVLSGVFTATGSTETLSIAYSGGSWINGIQVRDLGSSGPGHNYWHDLYTAGYKFLRHSEWEYARKYELDGKVPVSRTVNGKALSSDVTLTGADIPGVVTPPVYNGQNHAFLTADDLVSGENFASMGVHRWVMPRKGIVYARLISTSNSATVRIGVNVAAGATDVDDAHCVTALSKFRNETSVVVPLFLNAGDEVCLAVSTNPLQYVLFSCFYTD